MADECTVHWRDQNVQKYPRLKIVYICVHYLFTTKYSLVIVKYVEVSIGFFLCDFRTYMRVKERVVADQDKVKKKSVIMSHCTSSNCFFILLLEVLI